MKKAESFEKICGKYLFEHKKLSSIKTKEKITATITSADIRESSKEEIIYFRSLHSSLKDEPLSFLYDEEKSKIFEKLTEDFRIRNEAGKNIFISSTFLNSNLKTVNNTDDDIFEFKKKTYTESILNKNDEEKTKPSQKSENPDTKKSTNKNIIYEPKNMIIIKALIYLNKDDITFDIENFNKRLPDLNKSNCEEDNKFEKNVYIRIEDRIREYLNKIKLDKLSQLRDIEPIYLKKLIEFPKKSEKYKYICIKGIIIGLLNIINDLIGKEYLKLETEQKSDDLNKGNFILEIYDKYEIMKKICSFIEKDFSLFIDKFKEENNCNFNLIDVIADIFWDYVFRIKEINKFYSNNYGSEKIDSKFNETFDKIVDILINIDLPYKKLIGEKLQISCIQKEKYNLMEYIIKYRDINNKKKSENNNNVPRSSSGNNNLNNKNEVKKEEKNEEKNIDIKNEKHELKFDFLDKNFDLNFNLDLGKSLSMDLPTNKLTDKDSLDKVYNYILCDEDTSRQKKTKKRHKKRKKNKNNKSNNDIDISEDKNEGKIDPAVEDFKNFLNELNNKRSKDYIKKIKPNIKEEWLLNIKKYDDK